MRTRKLIHVAVLLLALGLSLSGCAGKTASSKFFVLSPLPQPELNWAEGRVIGVFPVGFPDYLDGPQIATRISENEIKYDEFSRWAEPLSENFYTVLVENLSSLLNSEKIIKTSRNPGIPVAMRVRVEVVRFDGVLGGDAVLSVKWIIIDAESNKAKRSHFR
jgi:uncharacterized lipoprotein YmbA